MGIYLNPGAQLLRMSRRSRIYVDKSGMVPFLNRVSSTEQRFVCVSRPRRFGKTMAANMVSAYCDRTVDGASEFAGLAASRDPELGAHRNQYDAIRIDMQQFLSATHDVGKLLDLLSQSVARGIVRAYDGLFSRSE